MARSVPDYRWWRPLLTVLTAAGVYCALTLIVIAVLLGVSAFVPSVAVSVDQAFSEDSDLRDPGQLAVLLGAIGLLWPAAALGVRWGGRRPAGTLSSTAGRLRWKLFPKPLALAALLFLATNAVSLLVPGSTGAAGGASPGNSGAGDLWLLLLVIAVIVPIQAAAEEYAFRGLAMQVLGSWLRHPAFAILVPVPLFVLGHDYGIVGQIDVAAFAVAAGWITWRTGGLEAAIVLHVVNNVGVLGLGAVGLGDPNATDLPLAALPFSLAFLLAYSLLVVRWFPATELPPSRNAEDQALPASHLQGPRR